MRIPERSLKVLHPESSGFLSVSRKRKILKRNIDIEAMSGSFMEIRRRDIIAHSYESLSTLLQRVFSSDLSSVVGDLDAAQKEALKNTFSPL
jgi:hypothetical protein